MDILDFLPSEDLIKIAAMNPRFVDIIIDRYIIAEFRFHERLITIYFAKNQIFSFHEHSNGKRDFLSRNTSDTLLVLEIFGHSLMHLRYELNDLKDQITETVFEYAAKYSPQATKEIEIAYIGREKLANWSYAFDNTTTQVKISQFSYNEIRLNDLFPFMESLIVNELKETITRHYPHLRNCSIRSNNDDKNKNVHEFIRLNPQLRYFHTSTKSDAKYMKLIRDNLVNLESLSIQIDIYSNRINSELVRFGGVKEFTLDVSTSENTPFETVIRNIQFDQLEVLKLNIYYIAFAHSSLIEIIGMNKGLKKFETNLLMRHESFVGLLEALPQLQEIKINCDYEIGWIDSLAPLLTTNHPIHTISLNYCHYMRIENFEEIAPMKWHIIEQRSYGNKGFLFTRLN